MAKKFLIIFNKLFNCRINFYINSSFTISNYYSQLTDKWINKLLFIEILEL